MSALVGRMIHATLASSSASRADLDSQFSEYHTKRRRACPFHHGQHDRAAAVRAVSIEFENDLTATPALKKDERVTNS